MKFTLNINKEASKNDNSLVIDINASSISDYNQDQVKKLAESSADTLALSFLIQEENKYQRKGSGRLFNEAKHSFQSCHISHSQVLQALKLMTATGKLYFNNKSIVCDFYSQNEYYYVVDRSGKNIQIKARVKTSLQDFDLTESDFICGGPPHVVIKGISLKLISTYISWMEMKKAYYNELKLQDIEDDPDNENIPKIIYTGTHSEKSLRPEDPLPVLRLQDRTGAFADLWMEYEDQQLISYNEALSNTPIRRNLESEKNLEKDLLETDYIKKKVGKSHYYCPLDKVGKSIGFLIEVGWHVKDYTGKTIILFTASYLRMEDAHPTILIKGKMKFNEYEVDVSSLAGTFSRKERFVQLSPDKIGLMPQSWEEMEWGTLFEEGEIISEGIKLSKSKIGLLKDLWKMEENVTADVSIEELKMKIDSFEGLSQRLPSADFKGELRSYQQEGVNWISFLYEYGFHGILADDMGLGKTIQVLAFISRIETTLPLLIVVPTSLLFNWRKEIQHFLPDWQVTVYHGPDRSKSFREKGKNHLILTSYTVLRLDILLFQKMDFQCVILDEAQVIKNSYTQTFQAVCKLKSLFRLSLTGTPLENNLSELGSHFHFLMPDLLGSQKDFESELAAGASDFRYFQRIKKKIRPFILRRKKEDVAKDLPEKIEQTIWVEMTPIQKQIYNEFLGGVKRNLLKKIEIDGASKHRMEVLEAILRLRQICCHPLLVKSGDIDLDPIEMSSSKLEILLQDLETLISEGKKVLVYSQFTSMLKIISKELTAKKWSYVYLDGSTVDREKIVEKFQSDISVSIFLISLKAGGIGLNLTQADYVLIYDPWWNEAAENQAIDRAHRIGRQNVVISKRYVTLETIEEKMMTLKAHKRSMIGEILDENWNNTMLSSQDLLVLLS